MSHASISDSAVAGRGRGAHVNQPAWMKKQEQPSAHDGQGNIGVTANSFAAMATASSGPDLLSSSSNASGSGLGRGRYTNLPDWVARQESAPSNEFSEMRQQVPAPSVTPRATPATISHHPLGESTSNGHGRGRGRGRGANKNLPAWMTNPSDL
jgi:hypothetical protein